MRRLLFQKLRASKKEKEPVITENQYYENVSARLGILQVILYFSLFAFVVLSFARNTNLITYRNFYYFFKDLDASAEQIDVWHSDSVSYPTSDEQSFTLYRGGLAVAGNNSITVFTATGRQTVSQTVNYHAPRAEGAGKYLLVYEMGGTQYSLYNSYTQVFSSKSEYPIYGAAVSDSGMYALLSSDAQHTSVVTLYSNNFSLLNRYSKNDYITDVSINEKGTLLSLLITKAEGSRFQTTAEFYEPKKTALYGKADLGYGIAAASEFTASNRLAVMGDDRLFYVSSNGEILQTHEFAGLIPVSVDFSSDGMTVSLQESEISEKNHIIVFDKGGKMLYNNDVPVKVEEIRRSGDVVYLKTLDGILRLDTHTGEFFETKCYTSQHRILAVGQNEVLLCASQKAEYIRFSK